MVVSPTALSNTACPAPRIASLQRKPLVMHIYTSKSNRTVTREEQTHTYTYTYKAASTRMRTHVAGHTGSPADEYCTVCLHAVARSGHFFKSSRWGNEKALPRDQYTYSLVTRVLIESQNLHDGRRGTGLQVRSAGLAGWLWCRWLSTLPVERERGTSLGGPNRCARNVLAKVPATIAICICNNGVYVLMVSSLGSTVRRRPRPSNRQWAATAFL